VNVQAPKKLAPLIIRGSGLPPATTNGFESEIVASDGLRYKAVKIKKVEPDGLFIDYSPVPGAIGSAKLKFVNMPEDIQRKYGYDPQKAKAFEDMNAAAAAEAYERRQIEEAIRQAREAEEQRIRAELAKEQMELDLKLAAIDAANRTADAIERQNLILKLQQLEQQRIADGIQDLDWQLMLTRHHLRP
jgi:hypothetical protein